MLHVMLFPMLNVLQFYISTSRSVCAVPSVAVFCSSLISCFPVMLLRYYYYHYCYVEDDSRLKAEIKMQNFSSSPPSAVKC
jgi:hypothetical protein